MNIGTVFGLLLVLSTLGNVFLFGEVGDSREAVVLAQERQRVAEGLASTCSTSVTSLRIEGDERRKRAQASIEAARKEADAAKMRAGGERSRAPAVPGNACASAQVENREWLQRRQGVKP